MLEKVWISTTDVSVQLSDKPPLGSPVLALANPALKPLERDNLLCNVHKLQAMANPYEGFCTQEKSDCETASYRNKL